MIWLVLGLALFLGVHGLPAVANETRQRAVEHLGLVKWKGLFSLLSLAGLALIAYGYGQARLDPVVLYSPPLWMRHVTVLLMLPVFVLLLATYLPGRIRQKTHHPMLLAVKIWATAHLFSNGTLADVLLFGSFLAWAVVDRVSLRYRQPKAEQDGALPFGRNDVIALVLGIVIYVFFTGRLHLWLIGVPPIVHGA